LFFAYSLRGRASPGYAHRRLTVLDQINHHAATMGVTAFYCPLTPSGGLRFNNETEASPLVHVVTKIPAARVKWTGHRPSISSAAGSRRACQPISM